MENIHWNNLTLGIQQLNVEMHLMKNDVAHLEALKAVLDATRDSRARISAASKALLKQYDEEEKMEAEASKCAVDPYAGLEASGWIHKHTDFNNSDIVMKIMQRPDSAEYATSHYKERILYFLTKTQISPVKNHDLDHTCLDVCSAGLYMDDILWNLRKVGKWDDYKQWYDRGIQLIGRLCSIYGLDDTNDSVADAIHGLVITYKSHDDIHKI